MCLLCKDNPVAYFMFLSEETDHTVKYMKKVSQKIILFRVIFFKGNLDISDLLKLLNALLGLASLIKQRNLFHSKKETISAEEKMNEFI